MEPTSRPAGTNISLPATIWLAPVTSGRPPADPAGETGDLVPPWAIQRIRTEFTHRRGQTPAPLLHIDVPDLDAGMDQRARHLQDDLPHQQGLPGRPVLLAQFRPEAVAAAMSVEPHAATDQNGLPGFFYRAHRLLRHGGLLLVACRQQHRQDGELTDPCGHLVAAARSAGFVYRQHILIVHATARGNHLHPAPCAPEPQPARPRRHRTIHTDLLMFTPA